ncbi:MAG: carboxypeptidase-like regulatory domain-containing protein [Treponema sp.]|nr:carboxypeptidase-like regulatory domain-containing protein [Treponema sp.]
MKKTVLFLLAAMVMSMFVGCASMPEPKDENSNMLYGCARYKGLYVFGGRAKTASSEKVDGIHIIVKNFDDGMTYAAETNKDGEFYMEGVTPGHYVVKYLGTEYKYDGKKWQLRYNIPASEENAKFTVRNGVTNMGCIVINVDSDSGEDYVSWAQNLDEVKEKFANLHPNSKWSESNWSNSNE